MPEYKNNTPILTERQREVPQLAWVDSFGRLLDSRFRIPGTRIRFGLDFLLGLVPYAGDVTGMVFSGLMIATMARHGASGRLVARMLGNVALDALAGAVPFLGDIFDLFYKANLRNLKLMRQHYGEGKHQGSAWPLVAGLIVVILAIFLLVAWLAWVTFSWFWGLITG